MTKDNDGWGNEWPSDFDKAADKAMSKASGASWTVIGNLKRSVCK